MADVELLDIRLFLMLAEELHFDRTAERLGLTTSQASQTLRALERKLGGRPLFDRTSRVVTLTEAGHALHDSSHRSWPAWTTRSHAPARGRGRPARG
ncbi:MAG: LysR family transcriptional regulator [Aldersonia sp.]|nr:LysR family transcriptional regulator [Aldersonia sp.]